MIKLTYHECHDEVVFTTTTRVGKFAYEPKMVKKRTAKSLIDTLDKKQLDDVIKFIVSNFGADKFDNGKYITLA